MANYDDYRLEEAEDTAMNDSQTAKRVAIGGAAAVAGGAAVYAGTQLADNGGEDITSDDLANAFDAGEITDEVIVDDQPQEVHVYHHNVVPEPEPEPEIEFTESDIVYDENDNVVGSVDKGTIDGKSFALIDDGGDGRADWLGIDGNKNGVFEENEIIRLDDNVNIRMGNAPEVHHHHNNVVFVEPEDPDFTGGEPEFEEDITNDYDARETEEFGSNYDNTVAEYPTDEVNGYDDMASAEEYAPDDIVPDDLGSDLC